MSILAWIFLGTIAGYLAGKAVKQSGVGIFIEVVLVIAGAVYGGFFFTWLGAAGATGIDLFTMFSELVGLLAVLVIGYAMFGRRRSNPIVATSRTTEPRATQKPVHSDAALELR
jgi:uncharacterized membrane protein YeaQ/YmgE (transglycosylase-associated protein family)